MPRSLLKQRLGLFDHFLLIELIVAIALASLSAGLGRPADDGLVRFPFARLVSRHLHGHEEVFVAAAFAAQFGFVYICAVLFFGKFGGDEILVAHLLHSLVGSLCFASLGGLRIYGAQEHAKDYEKRVVSANYVLGGLELLLAVTFLSDCGLRASGLRRRRVYVEAEAAECCGTIPAFVQVQFLCSLVVCLFYVFGLVSGSKTLFLQPLIDVDDKNGALNTTVSNVSNVTDTADDPQHSQQTDPIGGYSSERVLTSATCLVFPVIYAILLDGLLFKDAYKVTTCLFSALGCFLYLVVGVLWLAEYAVINSQSGASDGRTLPLGSRQRWTVDTGLTLGALCLLNSLVFALSAIAHCAVGVQSRRSMDMRQRLARLSATTTTT